MKNKRRYFKTACLASIAVLIGACSSTPEVKKQVSVDLQASTKQKTPNVIADARPVEQVKIEQTEVVSVAPKAVAKSVVSPTSMTRKKLTSRQPKTVYSRKPVYTPKKNYVPPKPIVVAVHSAPKPATKVSRQVTKSRASTLRRKASSSPSPKVVQQAFPRENPALRRPSLPRASAAMVAGEPIFRPAKVPTRNSRSQAQNAKLRQIRAQQEAQAQQQARAQWQQEQKALSYRLKWEKDQRAKAQQQQSRAQQAQMQLARAQQQQQQRARVQQAQQQQSRAQQAKMQQARIWQAQQAQQQQARVQQAQARQQQARVQQASYKPRVSNTVLRRPTTNYSQSRITGDFAGNPRAEAFVRMMTSRHGFDASYVAGVLSRAEATPWLRKQAYKDANPVKRTKRSVGPSWSNYRRRFITPRHINGGTSFYHRYKSTLQRAASQYGVPEEYILGIMGVETIYGGNVGKDRAIDALATMGFMNARRGNYFTSELESYFLMTRNARLDPLQPKASWAGALGLPQFMPSNIKKYGVDYDGDGAVNLWTPHDAIGSIANYLRKHGWKPGEIAAIPAVRTGGTAYANLKNGFKYKYSLSKLARSGLKPSYPGVSGMVNMVKLRTNRGNEYWVGGPNFYVITRYNHSSHYAMAVHQLAQEIRKRVKPGSSNSMPRVIEASNDQDLLMQAASSLL